MVTMKSFEMFFQTISKLTRGDDRPPLETNSIQGLNVSA
uniref:Uncharacterized protein n=1 Tax=Lepeophtheirus salmonis TaxID=72036 RepID=A0A0K2TPR3_LEPSM